MTEPVLLPSRPVVGRAHGDKDPDGFGCTTTSSRRAGGWCYEQRCSGPDDFGEVLCLDPVDGFTYGEVHWAGGATVDLVLELSKSTQP